MKDQDEITIMQVTDLHYLSPSLTDYSDAFMNMLKRSDGKLSEYSTEILDRVCKIAKDRNVDALLLTGDLTYNGELVSLKEIKESLVQLEESGINVYVIPGNHDINYPYAYRYLQDHAFEDDNISQENWKDMMKRFGYEEAFDRDSESFSYIVKLTEKIWLLALDCNTDSMIGTVKTETMQWLESVLQKAQDEDAHIISMTHQNVLAQSSMMTQGFVISNADDIVSLYEKYGVHLNLSGHSHLQHTSTQGNLTDICTESVSVTPLRYGYLQFNQDGEWEYQKESIGILLEEADQRFNETNENQLLSQLAELDISEEDLNLMVTFATQANRDYFSDTLKELTYYTNQKGWKLWETYASDSFWYVYMKSYLIES